MKRCVFLLGAGLAVCSAAFGDVWYVDKDNTASEDGRSWDTAFTAVQAGIDAAFDDGGGEVWVGEGVYDEVRDNDTGSVVQKEGVHTYGGFAGTETAREERDWQTFVTTIDGSSARAGEAAYHVVIGAGSATLDGFTIAGGNANGSSYAAGCGGGMYNSSCSSLSVWNCTFTGNSCINEGGGISNDSSSPTVTNCTFTGNSSGWDGGAVFNNCSSPTVTNCTFMDNSADDHGGAMSNWQSSPTITDCTFTGNSSGWDGGAVFNWGSSPTVSNCTFTANSAGSGGGVYNDSSSPTVTNCTFTGNSAVWGGAAVQNDSGSSATVTNCSFTGNSADWGGGAIGNWGSSPRITNCTFVGNQGNAIGGAMLNYEQSSPTVSNCTFLDNSSGEVGGAMYNWQSSPTVTDCTFTSNEASSGGAMRNDESSPVVTNSIFTGNSAGSSGGAVFNWGSSPTVTNCTFEGNEAISSGGAMYSTYSSLPSVTNCIFWNGRPDEIYSDYDSGLDMMYCNVQGGYPGTGNINANPLFVNAANGDYHLSPNSPCIDAGHYLADVSEDFEGDPRPCDGDGLGAGTTGDGSDYDIGADEYVPGTGDTDGDGLSDGVETNTGVYVDETDTGTDPNDTDSDGDGLPDGWEVDNDLDPNDDTGDNGADGDPDGDNYTNLDEYEGGSDPQDETSLPPVTAAFRASPTSGQVPVTVDFTDESTGDITSWSWNFGDGGSSTAQNPSHTYSSTGSFTVSLTVSGPAGSDTETKTDYIYVSAQPVPPVADFSASLISGNRPLAVDFTDESNGTVASRSWDFGDGYASVEEDPSHTYYFTGEFTVTLTVSGPAGSDSQTAVVHVDQALPADGLTYKTFIDDVKVTYSQPTCFACYNHLQDSLLIAVWGDEPGVLRVVAQEEAPLVWNDRCDVYIDAPDTYIRKIIAKGIEDQMDVYVSGQVDYVKNFILKYGFVGGTLEYGEGFGLGSSALDPPKKILIKWGATTAPLLGVSYPDAPFDLAPVLKSKPPDALSGEDEESDDLLGETKAAYTFEYGDVKVLYSLPGCTALYDETDETLKIEISESDGNLTVKCGEEAYLDWGDYCDVYIDAPNASVTTINLKGRPETQLRVAGEVEYVKNFKLKYGCVGDTEFYGPDFGLYNTSLILPNKILIKWGWATAPVLGVSY